MSIQAGIWHFDGKPVDPDWLTALSQSMKQHGPDGEFFFAEGPIGMLYRPFHTTLESRRERQPWTSQRGNVITWDGRLDNAADIRRDLGFPSGAILSEPAVALLAFEQWGVNGLGRLLGDFALAIWQPRERKLLFARDSFAIRPLFYHVAKDQVSWCTDLAKLALQPGTTWTLDESFIAGFLTGSLGPRETPYREIHGVGAGAWVEISPQTVKTGQFWQLEPGKYKDGCRSNGDYEEMFRYLFRQSVRRRLRSDRAVLAQLSGGMDSSSIVCVADDLLREEPALAPRLETITHYDDTEPTGDEREWAKYVEARRGRTGYHLDTTKLTSFRPARAEHFMAVPGATEGMIRMQHEYHRIATECGSRVLLSGLGGDEFTGGVPDPTPQLADLIVRGRLLKFARLLKRWSTAKKRPAAQLALESILLLSPASVRGRWGARAKVDNWLDSGFARRQSIRTRRAGVFHETPSWLPTRRINISLWKHLASGSGATAMIGQREVRLPFLDRDLVEFLTGIPEDQLLRPGLRRSLMRRALAGSVPAEVFNRRQKAAVARGVMVAIAEYMPALQVMRGNLEVVRYGFTDAEPLWLAIRQAATTRSDNLVGMMSVLALEHWLRDSAAFLTRAGSTLVGLESAIGPMDFSAAAHIDEIPAN